MKTAAIVIENWKLPIFTKILAEEGYAYSEFTGPNAECTILKVETQYLPDLIPVVQRMNTAAAQFARNQKLH